MRVRATAPGFFGPGPKARRIKPGEILEVTDKQFSAKWMEKVDAEEPAHRGTIPVRKAG